MLTEMIEYGCKIKEKVKAMQSEIKIYREPTVKEGNEDSNQQLGTKGRNKHLTKTERRNKNSKK